MTQRQADGFRVLTGALQTLIAASIVWGVTELSRLREAVAVISVQVEELQKDGRLFYTNDNAARDRAYQTLIDDSQNQALSKAAKLIEGHEKRLDDLEFTTPFEGNYK